MHIAIWGTGKYCEYVIGYIEKVNYTLGYEFYQLDVLIDNDLSRENQYKKNIKIINPKYINDYISSTLVIAIKNYEPVEKQIKEIGISNYYNYHQFMYEELPIQRYLANVDMSILDANMVFQRVSSKMMMGNQIGDSLSNGSLNNSAIIEKIPSYMYDVYGSNIDCAEKLELRLDIQKYFVEKKKNKTILISNTRYYNGGIERVISYHMQMFMEQGYKVILLTDEMNDNEYSVPKNVIRINLCSRFITPDEWFDGVVSVIKEYDVGIIISHQYLWEGNYYLSILCKLLGCTFVIESHNFFGAYALGDLDIYKRIYSKADVLVCLSKMDMTFWQRLNISCLCIPNPIIYDVQKREKINKYADYILWLGRLEPKQKNIYDLVEIAYFIKRQNRKIRIHVVGTYENPEHEKEMIKRIKEKDVEDVIVFEGFNSEVAEFYNAADIFIMTSAHEGFPMVLVEAMSSGVPVITYSMPYLELLEAGKGYIEVPQRDVKRMSQVILSLYGACDSRQVLSEKAIENIESMKNVNIFERWENAIINYGIINSMYPSTYDDNKKLDEYLISNNFNLG